MLRYLLAYETAAEIRHVEVELVYVSQRADILLSAPGELWRLTVDGDLIGADGPIASWTLDRRAEVRG